MLRGSHDNWEKLVGAVLEREELRRLAFCESLRSSFSDRSSSRFSFDSVLDQFNWSKQIRKSDQLILDGGRERGSSSSNFSGHYQEVVSTKKVEVKVDISDDRVKRNVMKSVSSVKGIDSIAIAMKEQKITIVGKVDPIKVVGKLRKLCHAELLRVGPAKEPEKKEEPKKEEAKKEEPKKEEPKKEETKKEEPKKEELKKEEPKKDEAKKEEPKKEETKEEAKKEEPKKEEKKPEPTHPEMQVIGTASQYRPFRPYDPPMPTYYPIHHSMEEDPNACIIS